MYTGKDLNHTSIAFDEQLNELYSFGRKKKHNPFIGGFIREEASEGLFKHAACAIYKCHVTISEFERMRRIILQIEREKELYKYNLIGLIGVAMNIEIPRAHAFFCSQFVATIMKECVHFKLETPAYFVQPHHFEQHPSLQLIYEGALQGYLYSQQGKETVRERTWERFDYQMQA